ncbi:hypothetical protein DL765_005856 [Monosporascus sp. GIB2]|nr:hypothetical protein DL765_005856 [Monosporascus sp. GIB2]
MAPVEVTPRTRWVRRWKRSAKTTEQSASWTRNNPRSGDAELPMRALRGTARLSVKFKRGGQGRTGGEDSDGEEDGGRRGRSPSPSRGRNRRRDEDSESDDRGDAESDYDVGEDEDLEDDLTEWWDRDTPERETEEDGTGQNNGLPPPIPDDPSPPYATGTPLIETTASMAPSNGAESDVSSSTTVAPVSEITVGPVDGPTATMTPIIQGVVNDEYRPISTVPLSIIEPTAAEPTLDPSTIRTAITSKSSELPSGPQFDRVVSVGDDFGGSGGSRGGLGPPPPDHPHRLAQGAQHALIAVGAIGAFILFCFVAWLMYLAVRRFRNNSTPASWSPWKPTDSNNGRGTKSLTHIANGSPPVSEESVASMLEAQGYYARAPVDSTQSGGHVFTGTLGSQQGTFLQPPNNEATYVYGHTPGIEPPLIPGMNLATGQPRMSGPNNQPLADSQPSAMDAVKRQTYRDSEISSLSSGFGDGDIIIQQSLTAPPPPVAARQEPLQQPPRTPNYLGRFSWVSRSSSGRRETVYTQTSEDRPVRFRSINSWVNQQTGRVRRANSRAKERGEVPVMPAVPGELNVTQQTAYK